MNYSSSSSSPRYKGLESQQHQERDWLCCSASSATQIDLQDEENEQENTHQQSQQEEGNNNINDDNSNGMLIEKEHMFDKVVTPSDVGKLNRLVIPKQHAEKYFPLDSTNNHKVGLLLNFEDLSGKTWRFRYSYWNSSQSYVMTKGWSRFVKEKKLNAGDIVSFHRGVGDELAKSRFFIDWRRRPPDQHYGHHHLHLGTAYPVHHPISTAASWTVLRSSHPYDPPQPHPHPHPNYPWRGAIAPTYWDHTSTSTAHLAPMNMSMMNMVPSYNAAYGSSSTCASVVNNPSLIFLRSSMISPSIDPPPPPNLPSQFIPSCSSSSINHQECRNDHLKVYNSVPVNQGKAPVAATKRSLRLFGVNMDCSPISNDDEQIDHNSTYNDQQQISAASFDLRSTSIMSLPSTSNTKFEFL